MSIYLMSAVWFHEELTSSQKYVLLALADNANDDGELNLSDAVSLLDYLFQAGNPPVDPGPYSCGVDPTEDFLGGLCNNACF